MTGASRHQAQVELPTDEIIRGLRELDDVPGYRRVADLAWCAPEHAWAHQFTLRVPIPPEEISDATIPEVTAWVTLIDPEYPHGRLVTFPAAHAGITGTYPHQKPNLPPQSGRWWRRGEICVTTPYASYGRAGYDAEPRAASVRLTWHLTRASEWVAAARRGILLSPGEPFELPVYAESRSTPIVAFDPSSADLAQWTGTTEQSGLATLVTPEWNAHLRIITAFGRSVTPHQAGELPKPSWGTALRGPWKSARQESAVWVRLSAVLAVKPWRAPATWGELVSCLEAQGVHLPGVLKSAAHALRDGKAHLLLLGAPLPVRVGDAATIMHWLAIRLPVLSSKRQVAPGYRPSEQGYWTRDRKEVLRAAMSLTWVATENWSPDEIATRGRAAPALRQSRVVLLGAGALGSAVGELLVREGVGNLTVLDLDGLGVGNLVRHTLTLHDVGCSKARALADRLNSINPHATVVAVHSAFPGGDAGAAALRAADLVIDCTASDAVIPQLTSFDWGTPKCFVSCAVGLHARRLFTFTACGDRFPGPDFAAAINPWILAEREEFDGVEMPWEATGCWHPVFPARASDFALFAAAVVRRLEVLMTRRDAVAVLTVLEQRVNADGTLELHATQHPPEPVRA